MASPTRTTNSHPWYLIIDNLPRRFTWQNLKDMIRCAASHGVWTDMQIFPSGQDLGRGQVRVKRDDEARRLYHYLTSNPVEGRRLRVHLYDTSHERDARCDSCNCESAIGPPVRCPRYSHPQQTANKMSQIASATTWQSVTHPPPQPLLLAAASSYPSFNQGYLYGVQQPIGQMSSIPAQTVSPTPDYPLMAAPFASNVAQGGTPYAVNWTTAAHTAPQYQRSGMLSVNALQGVTQPSATSHYTMPRAGMPVNITNGAFPTERLGVFVSGLSFKSTEKEVKVHFGRAGSVLDCDMPSNPATGKCKGNAVIQYASTADALRAIALFDKTTFKGMTLSVRHDANMVPIRSKATAQQQGGRSAGTPIIVNGSCEGRTPPDPTSVSLSTVKRALT